MSYVLPRYDNKIYYQVPQGEIFGHTDLGADKHFVESFSGDRRFGLYDKEVLVRHFTAQALGSCDLLTFALKDILKLKLEFPRIFG